jgi:hypothetical protein
MVSWPGDLLCIAGLAWHYRAGFLATAGFALPREPRVKADRARAGSAGQSTAGRNEFDTGKPRLMFASEEEPAGYWLPGQGLISPVQAWQAWTEHRRCSAVGAQIHLFGRDRKGQTEAGTAAQIGGSRTLAAASDRHASRPVFENVGGRIAESALHWTGH